MNIIYHAGIKTVFFLNQQRYFKSWLIKTTLHFLLFEDKGRLQICRNAFKGQMLIGTPPSKRTWKGPSLRGTDSRTCNNKIWPI